MPRRKPKHLYKPGEPSANPLGRPKGTPNEINRKIKEAFVMILENKLPELEEWLTRAAARDPLKTADLLLRISERFTPSLSRTEITGADGQSFTPITINIPNLRIGEGAPTSIPLQSGNLGLISEGAPTQSQPGHLEHLDSAVSKPGGHYEHLNSAVSEQPTQSDPYRAVSPELPDDEDYGEISPIFAPEGMIPMKPEDAFDPAQVKIAYEEWKAKQPSQGI